MEEVRDSLYFGFRGNYFPLKPLCLSLSSLISYLMTCTGMNMKSSSTVFREKIQFGKVERCINMGRRPVHFILSTLFIATIFSIFLLYSPNPLYLISKQGLEQQASSPMQGHKSHQKRESCDLSKGHWVRESRGSFFYSNSSCATIPESKNCFKQGRMDMDFLNWRWKPDQCDLPRFNAKTFLQIVQGKTMAFIGDSVARNHMESLLCLLSQEEIPEGIYKDSEDRFRTWYFRRSNFTLKVLWTKFLIEGEERKINGTGSSIFDLQLDKVDDGWANHLPGVDYAIVSAGHWFFRVMYLHEGDNVVGCVYCNEPNVTSRNVDFALQMSFRATFNYINGCKNCSGLVTLLRTFAPAHFENGAWNTGGYCNRTGPFNETEIDLTSSEWQMRNAQVKEIKRARKFGENQGKRFGVVDVTRAMLMRPDGHPGEHWGNKWKGGYNDCVHWCMPGPVDTWSEIFMAVLRKEAGLSSLYRVAAN